MKLPLFSCGALMPRLAALFVGALAVAALGAPAQASDLDKQALNQARDRMLASATVMSLKSFGYDGVTPFSMAFINRGSYASIKTPLQAGTSYMITGVGDDDAKDVDVIVQDSAGNLVAQDVEDGKNGDLAYASFTPRYGGNYTIFLKLADSRTSSSACALSIFRKTGGYKLSSQSVRNTTDTMFEVSQKLHDRFNTIYNTGTGQWAIVGSVLSAGNSSTFSGIATREGTYVFLAVGDEDMVDLDMKVRDANGKVLIIDEDDSNSAVCPFVFNSRQTCSLQLINAKSDDFSLVMHAILRV